MRRLTTLLLTSALLFTMTAMATAAEKAVTVKGWVSDTMCAAAGNKKCDNKAHLQQGAKLALVTDGDNKIWTVENPDKLADHMGHYVQVKGMANADAATIKVETASALPEPKQ
jgi:Spy/CpxP family protein refolding chaperone